MKNLLKLITVVFAVVSISASAEDAKPQGKPQMDPAKQQENFAKAKQLRVEGMQSMISIMQNGLSCVNGATNHEQMKACTEKEHQAMRELHDQMKQKMEAAGIKSPHEGMRHGEGRGEGMRGGMRERRGGPQGQGEQPKQ